jgi:lactoylglutathione lyase
MLRIKDPTKSVDFYKNKLGMTLIDKYDFPKWDFSLYFLASLKPGETYSIAPGTPEAHKFLWETDKVTLELTHNYNTEEDRDFSYHPGNKEKDGFGHIAFAVDDVYEATDELLAQGVDFKKKPDEGRMKGLAFAYDPDGYWVELVKRHASLEGSPKFSLSQTMLRIKDPSKSIPFYTDLMGMQLVAERHYGPDKGDFSLYFLCNKDEVSSDLPPSENPEAMEYIKSELYPKSTCVLELTHNHGTEKDETFAYHNGNVEPTRGFGHIGFLVDDVEQFCEELEKAGTKFQKKPNEGGMKGLAFALDPDGYWVEIIGRGFSVPE